jgi:hypothetical protein
MGSTNTTFLRSSLLLLYTPFSFNYFGNKSSFDRKLVKTIFPCPVRLNMEESEEKNFEEIYVLTLQSFYGKTHGRVFL